MKFGSAGVMKLAKIATSANRMSTTAPTGAMRCLRKRFQTLLRLSLNSASAAGCGWPWSGSVAAIRNGFRSRVFHPWIEPRVRNVGDEIEEHDEQRGEHQIAHEQREIELLQGIDEQPA